jgi:PadR family transcriptional regulator
MTLLSRSEEIILLAVWRLQADAFGLMIREEVSKATSVKWTVGSIYAPLHRLEKKGYIASVHGAPEPRRGGRSKVFYSLTESGKRALINVKAAHDEQWQGIPCLTLKSVTLKYESRQ